MESLDDLRRKIDAIDSDILARLKERTAIVEEVGHRKTKTANGKSFIRPGREASMLRDLTQADVGKFSKSALATIWRVIISSSLSVEQNMRIAAFRISGEEECYWLAREYFGAFNPVEPYRDVEEVLAEVKSGSAAVGVLPMPWHDEDNNRWWLALKNTEMKVFATIPFVRNVSEEFAAEALAIANVNPEPTGDDTTLICLTLESNVNDTALLASINTLGLKVRKFCSAIEESDVVLLTYVEGFYAQESDIIAALSKGDGVRDVKVIGAYANPAILG